MIRRKVPSLAALAVLVARPAFAQDRPDLVADVTARLSQIDMAAAAIAGAVFLGLMGLAWILARMRVLQGVSLGTLTLVPLAVYGLAAGLFDAIELPGGWAFEFRETASRAVIVTDLAPAGQVTETEPFIPTGKAGTDTLEAAISALAPGAQPAVTFRMGLDSYYVEAITTAYLARFLDADRNVPVLFLDANGIVFRAAARGSDLLFALDQQDKWRDFVTALETQSLADLGQVVELVTVAVGAGTTNAEALDLMVRAGADGLVKTDADGRPVGFVWRDPIVALLMSGLARD